MPAKVKEIFRKYLEKIENIWHFLGRQVVSMYLISLLVGIGWFAVESSFVFVLQGFLVSLKLMSTQQTFLPSWYPQNVANSIFLLIVFGLLRGLLSAYKFYLSEVTNQAFIRHQRSLILEYSLNFAHIEPAHRVTTLFNERISQSGSILQQVSLMLNTGIAFFLFFILGLRLAAPELILGLMTLALFMWPFRFFEGKIRKLGKDMVGDWDRVIETLSVGMKNHFYLKLYSLVGAEVKKGIGYLTSMEKKSRSYLFMAAFRSTYPQFIGVVTIGFLTWVGLTYFKTSGIVLLSLFYVFLRLTQSASELNTYLGSIKYSFEGFRVLYRWCAKARNQIQILKNSESRPAFELNCDQIHIEASNITFSFDSGKTILQNISFEVSASELLLIQGPSGSGKSTLVALILGLLTPDSGKIMVNGQAIADVRRALLKKLAYVGPEPYLIAGTVRENLLYGHPNPSSLIEEQLWDVLRKTALEKLVHGFSSQLNEILLETAQLSTGQKQRLAVARALLRKPQLLILDEATANLDTETESKLLQTFQAMGPEITMIVISHRPAFDKMADRRLHLGDEGTIAHA